MLNLDEILVHAQELDEAGYNTTVDRQIAEVVFDVRALVEENIRLRQALTQIACWNDGPQVTPTFDSPWTAQVARDALKGEQT